MATNERSRRFESAAATHPGIVRAAGRNQDAFEVRTDHWALGDTLVVVADGMGGPPAGDRASRDAVTAVLGTPCRDDPEATLASAYDRANDAVRRIDTLREFDRPGTTLVAAYFLGARCWIANVGDSRAYRLRARELTRLTHDHSLVQEEIDAGRLTEATARHDPRSSLITRTIGGNPTVESDPASWPLEAGDRHLLCTDGLWGVLDDSAIAQLLAEHQGAPQGAVDALIEASLEAGGPDNVTAVIVDVGLPIDELSPSDH